MRYTFTALINDSSGKVNDESNTVYFSELQESCEVNVMMMCPILIATYHVQNVSVYQKDDSKVIVECIFVYQSIADGCYIKLITDGSSITQSFNISLSNKSNTASQDITLSVDGNYSITAYDIVNRTITNTSSVHYDDIFQFISFVNTSNITTAITSVPSNIHPSINSTTNGNVNYV
jgi:hypothetical protein